MTDPIDLPTVQSIQYLYQQVDSCLIRDQHPLRRKVHKLTRRSRAPGSEGREIDVPEDLLAQIAQSQAVVKLKQQNKPEFEYPDLPVSQHKDKILAALRNHQVVIVAGETGSGKTTQLPKICLEAGLGCKGLIGHTQPRRLAARSVATRIAEELNTQIGDAVGFKVRFTDQTSDESYIKLMTDGILLAEIQEDRYLNKYDVLIIDEAHERSLNIDFILGYLKSLLPKRPELKVIITSATIDPERFSKHFNDAPMILVEGRTYPVEIRYRPLFDAESDDNEVTEQVDGILNAVNELSREGRGDILVFLSGEREIRDTAEFLNGAKLKHTEIVPLYARLSASEQNRIFQPHGGRRIVLATNVAETSLTVPGIRYVIDTGTARISRYSSRSKVQRLPIEPVSQASANQRSGRCGRVAEGICIRLYAEDDYLSRPEFTDPEILRTNLASVILQLTALRLGDMEQFPFVQPPQSRDISAGVKMLEELQAVKRVKDNNHRNSGNNNKGAAPDGALRLTAIGRSMSRLPVDPRYARMLVEAEKRDALAEIMIISAGLSIQEPRERPNDKKQKADELHSQWQDDASEFVALLNLWNGFREKQFELSSNQLRKWCKEQMLNYLRLREWQDIVSQLKQSFSALGWGIKKVSADYEAIHRSMLPGLLTNAGFLDEKREYLGTRNNKFFIFPGSSLSKKSPKWLMAAELVETSKLFARTVAKIEPLWLEEAGKHLCKYRYSEPFWSKKAGAVKAKESASMLGLPVVNQRTALFSKIDPQTCRTLFIQEALVNGETKLNLVFLKHNLSVVADIESMEDKIRRRDLLADEEVLFDFYDEKLPSDICTEVDFKKWWQKLSNVDKDAWQVTQELLLKREDSGAGEVNFPEQWRSGNLVLPLEYKFDPGAVDDGVSLTIPLPMLNQVTDEHCDWLVPGLREELAIAMIKHLPKQLRRNFVPAPDYAKAAISALEQDGSGFTKAFCNKLIKMSGVVFSEEEWDNFTPQEHLRFNFKLFDENNKFMGQSRDLHELKEKFKKHLSKTLKSVATPGLEKKDLASWDFDDLPAQWSNEDVPSQKQNKKQKSTTWSVKAYPGLQKDGNKVHLKLFDNEAQAKASHRLGLRQLLIKQLPSPIKFLQDRLPNKSKLGLYFNPFGEVRALINDCIDAVVDEAIAKSDADLRSKTGFDKIRQELAAELNDEVLQVAITVEKGLTRAHGVSKTLKGNTPLNMINAYSDVKGHLNSLVYPGFVSDIGVARLKDWNRYIEALAKRLEKIPVDPIRDRNQQLQIEKVEQRYAALTQKYAKEPVLSDELIEGRWLIEELRVSLFAQQLGTNMPISSKRIENYLDKF